MEKYEISGRVILRYEPYFECKVPTAIIDHNDKTIYPSHGYFKPHKYGKYNEKLANKLGYKFYQS